MKAENEIHLYGKQRLDDSEFIHVSPNNAKRSCTDVICCLIFLLCIFGSVACAVIGYVRGDPRRLLYPTDSKGHFCGNGNHKDKPHLFFFDLLQCTHYSSSLSLGCPTPQVCVAKCPDAYFTYLQGEKLENEADQNKKKEVQEARSQLYCIDGVDPLTSNSNESINSLVHTEKCASYYLPSTPVMGRCIPNIFKKMVNMTLALSSGDFELQTPFGEVVTGEKLDHATRYLAKFTTVMNYAELILKDLVAAWKQILIGMAIVIAFAMMWVFLLEVTAMPIVCLSILATFAAFATVGVYGYLQYKGMSENRVTMDFGIPESYVSLSKQREILTYTWLLLTCVSGVVCLLLATVLPAMWKHVRVAISLMEEASRCIFRMPIVMIWPLFPFILQMAVLTYWISSTIYLASMGEKQYTSHNLTSQNYTSQNDTSQNDTNQNDTGQTFLDKIPRTKDELENLLTTVPCDSDSNISALNSVCTFVKYGGNELTIYMEIYQLFMFLWMMNFMVDLGQLVEAGAFAFQYWTFNKNQCFNTGVFISFWRAIRYHLGSLAFGSFIIAVVQLVRLFLEFVHRKMRRANSKVALFIVKCLMCCLWCVEKCVKYLNEHAYIMIAMFGRNFCFSTKDAFQLLMRHIVQAGILDRVVSFMILISKLAITALTAVGAYYWFDKREFLGDKVPELHYSFVPVIILTFGALFAASVIFNVLDMAVDTLFMCYLEDLERNDGSPEHPYYMSSNLTKLLRGRSSSNTPLTQLGPTDVAPGSKSMGESMAASSVLGESAMNLRHSQVPPSLLLHQPPLDVDSQPGTNVASSHLSSQPGTNVASSHLSAQPGTTEASSYLSSQSDTDMGSSSYFSSLSQSASYVADRRGTMV